MLERRSNIGFAKTDVFTSAIGGVKVAEPAADLGIALALASSVTGNALDSSLVACGEIGLAGELRQSAHTERRLIEAARVGFTRAVIPAGAPPTPDGILGLRAETLTEALHLTGMIGGQNSGFSRPPARAGAPSGRQGQRPSQGRNPRQGPARGPELTGSESDVDWGVVRPLRPFTDEP